MFNREKFLTLIERVGVKKPVALTFSSTTMPDRDAEHEPIYSDNGRLIAHNISIFVGEKTSRTITALVAHELIHALHEENGVQEWHGEDFVKQARKLNIRGIYRKELDD